MCCRYYIDNQIFDELDESFSNIRYSIKPFQSKDIHPGDQAPVLSKEKSDLLVSDMRFGFPQYSRKGLLINARAETVLEKRTFSNSIMSRCCVILARHFYEWDISKNKAQFSKPDNQMLYLAGFYNIIENEQRFVILTTSANSSVSPIHERMPLILEKDEVKPWIYDQKETKRFLEKTPIELKMVKEYEQQNLFV